MNTTMEKSKMMENEMEMCMETQMPEMMKANLAGEMKQPEEEMNPIDIMMGVVKSQINDLCDEIDEADKAFARSHHNDKYSKATYDAEETCKLLNAQKGILDKVLFAMEDIKSSMMPECA